MLIAFFVGYEPAIVVRLEADQGWARLCLERGGCAERGMWFDSTGFRFGIVVGYYNRKGVPIAPEEWLTLFQDRDYQVLAQDTVYDRLVSTVWLGMSYGVDDAGRALIFETMIFRSDGAALATMGEFQWRYATEDEAFAGHAAALQAVAERLTAQLSLAPSDA